VTNSGARQRTMTPSARIPPVPDIIEDVSRPTFRQSSTGSGSREVDGSVVRPSAHRQQLSSPKARALGGSRLLREAGAEHKAVG